MTPSIIGRRAAVAGLAVGGLTAGSAARGQGAWPDKPIRMIVPFPPGALVDAIGRLVADHLRAAFGQPVVVDNKPGAGTLLGASLVAAAPADGHTLMVATTTTLGIAPALYANPPVRTDQLTGVAMIGAVTLFLVARPGFPAKTVKELVELVRSKPDGFTYASPTAGTVHHLVMELLKADQGLKCTHVPYKGSTQALTDLTEGRVDFMFLDATVALPQIKAGKIGALAVTGAKRSPLMPEVPAMTESFPRIDLYAWQAIAAAAGTPAAIVAKIHASLDAALATPSFRDRLTTMGVEATPMTVAAFNALIRDDAGRWARLVKESGAKAE